MGDAGEVFGADADLERVGIGRLQHQGRQQGTQIGIAAAFAQAVERALDLARAATHGRQRYRHRLAGVVVGVDSQRRSGQLGFHVADNAIDVFRQGAAIGVAQHDPFGAGVVRGADAGQRIVGIGAIAIEEMLGVEQRVALLCDHGRDGLGDIVQVFCARDFQGHIHLEVPGLAHQADGIHRRVQHLRQRRIIGGTAPRPLGHAERSEAGLFQ